MAKHWASPTVWMFQYQVEIYDLLEEIAQGRRTELWRAAQHRHRLREGERIYYLRGAGQSRTHEAAIVAVGTTRSRVMPFECSGCYPWVVDVQFDALVDPPLTREEMRADAVLSIYRPFFKGSQGTQFPLSLDVVERTEQLLHWRLHALSFSERASVPHTVGREYEPANEEFSAFIIGPTQVDATRIERANRSHAKLQNALERYVRSHSLETRSYDEREPCFDLAWINGKMLYVAEIKSLTKENEEMQLRLGFSQVLMYQFRLAERYPDLDVHAVLFVEREPTFEMWKRLCAKHRICLLWPEIIHELLD